MLEKITSDNIDLLSDACHDSITGIGALALLIKQVEHRFWPRQIEFWYADSVEQAQREHNSHLVVMRPLPGDDFQVYGVDTDDAMRYILVPSQQRLVAVA